MGNSRNLRRAVVPGVGDAMAIANPTLPVAHGDGSFHNERTSRLIEIIRETWPVLDVKYIPDSHRQNPNDPKYLIVEKHDGREYPVFFVKDDQEFDGSVLERLILSDSKERNVHNDIEAKNKAVRLIIAKKKEEEREARMDIVKHAIQSHKHGYTIPSENGPINLDLRGAAILRGEVD